MGMTTMFTPVYCINKCSEDCERNYQNAKGINISFGYLEGFPEYCKKATGAPADETDAPIIYTRGESKWTKEI